MTDSKNYGKSGTKTVESLAPVFNGLILLFNMLYTSYRVTLRVLAETIRYGLPAAGFGIVIFLLAGHLYYHDEKKCYEEVMQLNAAVARGDAKPDRLNAAVVCLYQFNTGKETTRIEKFFVGGDIQNLLVVGAATTDKSRGR